LVMVTTILLAFELPFGVVHALADATATAIDTRLAAGGALVSTLEVLAPSFYADPIVQRILAVLPGWLVVLGGFLLLFYCLKGFSRAMRRLLLTDDERHDPNALGKRLLGTHPLDTFGRGLIFTILVQSSSATTALVVPLAAMG